MYELLGALIDIMLIHPYFVDVVGKMVADGARGQIAFQINQRRGGGGLALDTNFIPEPLQVGHVALQRLKFLILARRAYDQAHIFRYAQLYQNCFDGAAILILELTGNASTRGVWTQDQIASGQRYIGGKRRPLIATLLLDHLYQHGLFGSQNILNIDFARVGIFVHPFLPVIRMNIVQGKKPLAARPIFDKGGLQACLYFGDCSLVDIAFGLDLMRGLNVQFL